MIYAFTGDISPEIERKTRAAGFKKTYGTFRKVQILEILEEIKTRD